MRLVGDFSESSQMRRFETDWLTTDSNLAAPSDRSGVWIDPVHDCRPPKMIILDMDSRVSPSNAEQQGSIYNGHFGCTCYHPLFVFNQFGDLERCALRPGNVSGADGWREVMEPVVSRNRERKPQRYHASFSCPAKSWDKAGRVVAKVAWYPGELFPRVGFIVTNLGRPAERVVAFYNQRGTAEQWIKEGNSAVNWTRLSCYSFRTNEVRLRLHALGYNLGNFLRTLALPKAVEHWSLTTL